MSSDLTLTQSDLQGILKFAIALARQAGSIILEGSRAIRTETVNEKKNAVDLVTAWDVKVEDLIKGEIKKTYPNFNFIGEESFAAGEKAALTAAPTFCVDPIDGTTNFVHGFPFVCVSIGLIYEKKPIIGVIYNPFLDQLYSALKGHGAFLNETTRLPIHPATPFPSLSSALVGIEWGSDRTKYIIDKKAKSFSRLAGDIPSGGKMVHSLRSLGSAALNYTLVASGNLDIYWEIGCWSWDVCAGIVLAEEAGGFVSGSPATPETYDGTASEDILFGRKYIVVRPVADTPEEKGRDAQRRIVREFYQTVEEWNVE